MTTIVITAEGEDDMTIEIPNDQLGVWQMLAAARGQTLSESFNEIVRDFLAKHPELATKGTRVQETITVPTGKR